MKHSIASFEREIVEQILISELCFSTCKSIPDLPGLGSHFLPYFHNLSYQKGVGSLHSVLLSQEPNELSLKNYLKLYKQKQPRKDISKFEKDIEQLVKELKVVTPFSLRNKIGYHVDGDFTHIGFTNSYLMPKILNDLIKITRKLKKLFFNFTNYALNDKSYLHLQEQIYKVIDEFTIEEVKKFSKKI